MSFIQLQRAGRGDKRTVYVTLATSTRLPGKKHSRQTRVHLGCLCSDGTNVAVAKSITGALRIDVPLQSLRDRAQRGGSALLEWLAQQIPATATVAQSKVPVCGDGKPTTVKKIGPAFVMRYIARALGLEEILCECFDAGESKDGLAILYLSMYQVAECRPLYQAYAWMDEQELPAEIAEYDFTSAGTSRLTARIGNDHTAIDRFFRMWIKKLDSPTSLIFDTTSVSSYSEHLDFAEWGYNRDSENLAQVNISLVSAREARLPVYFRMLPGSIPDVSTLKVTAALLKEYGITDHISSLDRGFYSAANLRAMIAGNIGFVVGVPHSCSQAKNLISKYRAALRSPKRSICLNGNIVRHAMDTWIVDMGKGEPAKKIAAHIYWDYNRHSGQEKELECRVFQVEAKALADMPGGFPTRDDTFFWLKENAKGMSCFFCPKESGGVWKIDRKARAIAVAAAKKGFSVVITTKTEADGSEILEDYRSRDTVEKLFDIFKNENGNNRLYTGNRQAVDGRLFLAFVAMIIHAELENRMRKTNLLKRYSVTEMLAVLRKLERVTMESGASYLMELTKAQRTILAGLAIPEPM